MSAQEQSQRRVLVIAYYFPPMGLSGVQRTLKFVKYLPHYGWQPTVLTVTPTGYFAQDYTLLDEIHPMHIDVHRVGSLDPNRLFRKRGVVKMPSEGWRKVLTFLSDTFFIPDNKILWKAKALKAAEGLFGKQNFDVIFATAPPFTDLLIGAELKKRFNRPLVLDYRDPWHEYPLKYYPTPFHKLLNYKLEKKVLHAASKVITTNRRVKEMILKRYKFLSYKDVIILPQGYDPQDFRTNPASKPARKKMRITHAGVFYGGRTPRYFLEALRRTFGAHPEIKEKTECVFIGAIHDDHLRMIKTMGLEGNVTTTGYLDHLHCSEYLIDSDVLWLMMTNDSQSPGKLYEYFGARKPVLACLPEGFLRQAVEETGAGIVVAPDDIEGISTAILKFYNQYKDNQLPKPKEEVVLRYDRMALTNELSKILGFSIE